MMLLDKKHGGRLLVDPSKITAISEDPDGGGCWLIFGATQIQVRLNFDQMEAALTEYEDESAALA